MEELRESIREKESQKIYSKEELLQSKCKYQLDEYLHQQFINEIPQDHTFLLNVLLGAVSRHYTENLNLELLMEKELYTIITFRDLINECLRAAAQIHSDIVQNQLNLHIFSSNIEQLQEQINIFLANPQLKFNQPCQLSISYNNHKSFRTEIFNFYKIKYKVAMENQELQSIYPIGHQQLCSLPIKQNNNSLIFSVLAKEIRQGEIFEEITSITMDLDEVFTSINPISYSKEHIQPCFLSLYYEDQRDHAQFKGQNIMELKFELSMDTQNRINMIKQVLDKQKQLKLSTEKMIENRDKSIRQILFIFQDLEYLTGIDIRDTTQQIQENRACECIIF